MAATLAEQALVCTNRRQRSLDGGRPTHEIISIIEGHCEEIAAIPDDARGFHEASTLLGELDHALAHLRQELDRRAQRLFSGVLPAVERCYQAVEQRYGKGLRQARAVRHLHEHVRCIKTLDDDAAAFEHAAALESAIAHLLSSSSRKMYERAHRLRTSIIPEVQRCYAGMQ